MKDRVNSPTKANTDLVVTSNETFSTKQSKTLLIINKASVDV